ncbi:proton-coupled folate transporter-like [Liolophura sinensis]|uniref:proton-coupled folate transporter-like n=1 Tax=Liolophura sinensis TaxID=3198878 RepID=UPI003159119B
MGDMVCYQYMYKFASVKLNFNPDNFSDNSSVCDVNKSSRQYQLQQQVSAYASSWQLYFALASGVPGLFSGVIYGTYSDKIGRRFLMVLSTVLVACRYIAYIIAIQFNLSLSYVIVGYILEGLGGSFNTMILACSAYTADVTQSGKSRSLRLMIVLSVSGFSEIVAYLSYGYATQFLGFKCTFLIVLGTDAFTLSFIAFLPESRSGKHMQTLSFRQYINRAFRFYTEKSKTNPYRYLYFLCGGSLFFAVLGSIQRHGMEVLYLLDSPFCWDSARIGDYQAISSGIRNAISLAALVVLLKCATEELSAVFLGLVLVGSFCLEAFSKTAIMMYAVATLGFSDTPYKLLLKTMASSKTDVDHQGALFASLQLVDSFCNTAGTVLCNMVYELTVGFMRGAVFLYMAGLCMISALLIMQTKNKKKNSKKKTSDPKIISQWDYNFVRGFV